MPGYRALTEAIHGLVADRVREATALERDGDTLGALLRYEEALAAQVAERREMPAFLCGRLAMVYRRLGLLDEEVALLEQYRDSQRTDEARSRYQARLFKARALADKKRHQDSGALASIRAVRAAQARRNGRVSGNGRASTAPPAVTATAAPRSAEKELAGLLQRSDFDIQSAEVAGVLARLSTSVDDTTDFAGVLCALKALFRDKPRPAHLTPEQWTERYSLVLQSLIAMYFCERSAP
jgi:hypothetical protein